LRSFSACFCDGVSRAARILPLYPTLALPFPPPFDERGAAGGSASTAATARNGSATVKLLPCATFFDERDPLALYAGGRPGGGGGSEDDDGGAAAYPCPALRPGVPRCRPRRPPPVGGRPAGGGGWVCDDGMGGGGDCSAAAPPCRGIERRICTTVRAPPAPALGDSPNGIDGGGDAIGEAR